VISGKLSFTLNIKLKKTFDFGKSTKSTLTSSRYRTVKKINILALEQLLSGLLATQMNNMSPFSTRVLFVRSITNLINDMNR